MPARPAQRKAQFAPIGERAAVHLIALARTCRRRSARRARRSRRRWRRSRRAGLRGGGAERLVPHAGLPGRVGAGLRQRRGGARRGAGAGGGARAAARGRGASSGGGAAARWGPRVCDLDLLASGERVLPDAATVRGWIAREGARAARDAAGAGPAASAAAGARLRAGAARRGRAGLAASAPRADGARDAGGAAGRGARRDRASDPTLTVAGLGACPCARRRRALDTALSRQT